MREIADDAGVNVALISRYFESKEGLFEACLEHGVTALARSAGGVSGLSEVAETMSRQVTGHAADSRLQYFILLLVRSSGDDRAERLRLGFLRSFGERLASAAGWAPGVPGADDLLLRAQVLLSVGIGIAVLRSSGGLEPLASADHDLLVAPLRDLVTALLGPGADPA